jgi:hypothetical protein
MPRCAKLAAMINSPIVFARIPRSVSSLFVVKDVPFRIGQTLRLHEADVAPPRIGTQNPRDLFHVVKRGMRRAEIIRAKPHREGYATATSGQHRALDDFVLETGTADDRGALAAVTEGRVAVAGSAALDLDTRGTLLIRGSLASAPPYMSHRTTMLP